MFVDSDFEWKMHRSAGLSKSALKNQKRRQKKKEEGGAS